MAGAAKALRRTWPLVFSKNEAVRLTVLDSWHVLHTARHSARQQVRRTLHARMRAACCVCATPADLLAAACPVQWQLCLCTHAHASPYASHVTLSSAFALLLRLLLAMCCQRRHAHAPHPAAG